MAEELNFEGLEGRLPPQNIEAEESILGGILLDPEAIGRIAELLLPDAFYISSHTTIYHTMLFLHGQGLPTDLISVASRLSDLGQLQVIGGQAKLVQLVDRTVSAVNIDRYAALVMDKYLRRQLIQAGREIDAMGYDTATDLEVVLDRAEQKVFNVTQKRPQQDLVPIYETLVGTFEDIEAKHESQAQPGILTDFYDFDAMTGGLQPSDLIIVAGRPSMGKTAVALNIAQNIAKTYRLPIAIFSLEMSKEQLVQRLLSSEAGIEANRLRAGRVSQNEWEPFNNALTSLSEMPIFIDDTPNIVVSEIRSKCRRLQAEQGQSLGLVLLDYLQLMEGGGDNRVQELSRITRSLKGLARELNVPVIALSQLSRGVEARTNKRPMMSDLRESGCLAGDTLVTLTSGERVPIRDLVDRENIQVWALDEQDLKLKPASISHAFSTGIKLIYRLTTRLGRTIDATANHKFRVLDGWVRLDGLKVTQSLAIPNEHDVVWDEIASIEPIGETDVYDLTVPGFHNFVANDIVVHNSIEQDADLIVMLYRDEYYNPDTPDRGITEMIIAKHRNGPTGIVKLLFESQYTRFRNMAGGFQAGSLNPNQPGQLPPM
ncbi:MAG: replicative DNA helicase [Coleofasciculaceae cyanobacterium RL_1_1]|nr:replicative DNA helicase [Coleofasciculaceae cyanobacterium RL_1_1]